MILSVDPPKFDWQYQRSDIQRRIGDDPIKIYIDKLVLLLQWDMSDLNELQQFELNQVFKECKYHLDLCKKHYILIRELLYPIVMNVDVWLRFFIPLADKHLSRMWYVTPYIPKHVNQPLSHAETQTLLNNVAHLFR